MAAAKETNVDAAVAGLDGIFSLKKISKKNDSECVSQLTTS